MDKRKRLFLLKTHAGKAPNEGGIEVVKTVALSGSR